MRCHCRGAVKLYGNKQIALSRLHSLILKLNKIRVKLIQYGVGMRELKKQKSCEGFTFNDQQQSLFYAVQTCL